MSNGGPVTRKKRAPASAEDKDGFLKRLGPGLITGASDDDPSGIGTYSQAGAQLGFGVGWTMLLTYPLMVAIQEISGRIGRITGMASLETSAGILEARRSGRWSFFYSQPMRSTSPPTSEPWAMP